MSYKHITIEERACIKKMKSEGSSLREIAKYLERSPSTISREIKRNKGQNGVYHPVTAQRLYYERKDNCGRKISLNYEIQRYINNGIDKNWSPEQIYFRSKIDVPDLNIPSFSTIYKWIHLGLIAKGDMTKLRRKGRFKRPQERRGRFNIGKTIKNAQSLYINVKKLDIGRQILLNLVGLVT